MLFRLLFKPRSGTFYCCGGPVSNPGNQRHQGQYYRHKEQQVLQLLPPFAVGQRESQSGALARLLDFPVTSSEVEKA